MIQYTNQYNAIYKLVQSDIPIGTQQNTNWYETIEESVQYNIQISMIQYTNYYHAIYESLRISLIFIPCHLVKNFFLVMNEKFRLHFI